MKKIMTYICALVIAMNSFAADSWIDLGEAVLMDGWVLPGLGINQTNPKYWYKVPVQKDADRPVYRLVDPYHIGPAADYNESTKVGYIVLDATDPDHVVVNPDMVSAGFASEKLGINEFYCYNMLGFACANFPEYTTQEIIDRVGDGYPYTTFKDGVFSLTYIIDEGEKLYDANYGNENNPTGGFHWYVSPTSSVSKDMSCRISLPADTGIRDSEIDEEEAPVEYFDMQGLPVSDPERGLYLRRQGSRTSKVLIK